VGAGTTTQRLRKSPAKLSSKMGKGKKNHWLITSVSAADASV